MWKVTNVAKDRRYESLRRTATKLVMEPIIGAKRLFMGSSIMLTEKEKEQCADLLKYHVEKGILSLEHLAEDASPVVVTEPEIPVSVDTKETITLEEVFGITEVSDSALTLDTVTENTNVPEEVPSAKVVTKRSKKKN